MELSYKNITLILSAFRNIGSTAHIETKTSTIFVNDYYLGRFAIDTKRKKQNNMMNLYFDGLELPVLSYDSFDTLDQFLGQLVYAKQHRLEHPIFTHIRENA